VYLFRCHALCLPSLVLTAQAIFLLQHGHKDTMATLPTHHPPSACEIMNISISQANQVKGQTQLEFPTEFYEVNIKAAEISADDI